tara:strand:- start:1531 stop:2349 length:819 start_codon:yes stop_codon:yes gene_type:complete
MKKYFVRRNENVNGPFSVEKIQKLVEVKKLKPTDEISTTQEGPWESVKLAYKSVVSGDFQSVIDEAEGVEDEFLDALDEYDEGDIVSDDEYISPRKRQLKEQKKAAVEAESNKKKRSSSKQLPLRTRGMSILAFLGFIVSLFFTCAGVFGILDSNGFFKSNEYLEAQAKADAAREKYESERLSNQRAARKTMYDVNGKPGGLVGSINDLNDAIDDRMVQEENEMYRQGREMENAADRDRRLGFTIRSLVVLLFAVPLGIFCFRYRFMRQLAD